MPGWQHESHPGEYALVRLGPGQPRSGNAHKTVHVPERLCSEEPHFHASRCHTHPQNNLMRLECGVFLPSTHLPAAFLASLLAGTSQVEPTVTGLPGFEAILGPHHVSPLWAQCLALLPWAAPKHGKAACVSYPLPGISLALHTHPLSPQFPIEGGCLPLLPCLGYY